MDNPNSPYRKRADWEETVYPVEVFRSMCENSLFIDYDGHGRPMKGMLIDPDTWIKPSRLHEIPDDATHIVWYNR